MLISATDLCKILLRFDQDESYDITTLSPEVCSIIAAVYPDRFIRESNENLDVNETPSNSELLETQILLETEFPLDTELIVMMSGGIGCSASFWKAIAYGNDVTVIFAEGMYHKNLETVKRRYIKQLMVEGKGSNGGPFIRGTLKASEEEISDVKTWLKSIQAPKNAPLLNRNGRVAVLIAMVQDWYIKEHPNEDANSEKPFTLVWGSIFECKDVLKAMSSWGWKHCVPFQDRVQMLYSAAHAEVISDVLKDTHDVDVYSLAPGPMMLPRYLNLASSCWNQTPARIDQNTPKPFLSMCGDCKGCERWIDASETVQTLNPFIRFGSKVYGNGDDSRDWSVVEGLNIEPRKVYIAPVIFKKATKRTKGRPKKKAVEKVDVVDPEELEEEEEEVKKAASEDELEESSESEQDDEAADYLYSIEEEEEDINDENVEEELPDDIFSEEFDDECGYGSDEGSRRKKKKKRRY